MSLPNEPIRGSREFAEVEDFLLLAVRDFARSISDSSGSMPQWRTHPRDCGSASQFESAG